jgi:hypothetical protein
VCTAADADIAAALLPERAWDGAVLVDGPLAVAIAAKPELTSLVRRIALIRPSDRAEWPALKAGRLHRLSGEACPRHIACRGTAQGALEQAIAEATHETLAPTQPATSKGLSVPRG